MKKGSKIVLSIVALAATSVATIGVKEVIDNKADVLVTLEDGTKILKSDVNNELFEKDGANSVQHKLQLTVLEKYYKVDEAEVNAEIENIKASYASEEEFLEVLAMYGYEDIDVLKEEIRFSILNNKAIADNFEASKEDVKAFYEDSIDYYITADYSSIYVEDKATADKIYNELKNGAEFDATAKKYEIEDEMYTPLTTYAKSSLDETITSVVFADLTIDEKLFEPIATDTGYVIAYAANFNTIALEDDYETIENNYKISVGSANTSDIFNKLFKKAKVEFKDEKLEKDIKKLSE